MKRLLLIAYFFPPEGGGGVQRPTKFCRYLPDFGWQPIVLTRDIRQKAKWSLDEDASLASEIGSQTQVHRVTAEPERDWARDLPEIDIARAWLEPALRRARELIAAESIGAVLITMSPFDLCFLGQRLADEFGIPVIYDLRDPWALDGWRLHGTRRRWRRDRQAMMQTLSGAGGVVANTPEAAKAIQRLLPTLSEAQLTTIPNGYDAADFAGRRPPSPDSVSDCFRLVHTGTFVSQELYRYEGLLGRMKRWRHYRPQPIDASGRTPLHLFAAIRQLEAEGHPLALRLRIVFVGPSDAATQRCIAASGLAERVHCTGYQSHAESLAWLCHADALFLPLGGLPPEHVSLIVPGKTYEYLAARRPILGCVPAGDAYAMVEQSGYGFCADPCDGQSIAAALKRLYAAWEAGEMHDLPAPAWLHRYERRHLTGELAAFMDRLTSREPTSPSQSPSMASS